MGKSRATRRSVSGVMVNLFDENTSLGCRVKYRVSATLALEKIALKQWRAVWYENGDLAGAQPMRAETIAIAGKTFNDVLIERLIGVTITLAEVRRNAGEFGESHTMGMPEWKRLNRHALFDASRILPAEDAIERAIAKVRQWPFPASVIGTDEKGAPVFGDKAVRVYPHAPASGR